MRIVAAVQRIDKLGTEGVSDMATCGEQLVRLLEAYGVDFVFGNPGVHTVELYRGLSASRIRHQCFEPMRPRSYFNSSTGYGTLGYALPAGIGAKLAAPGRPVVVLAGDGGLQFSIGELASAVDAKAPMLLLWNNEGYGEIKTYMREREIVPIGNDIFTPDFVAIALGFGWRASRAVFASLLKH